MKIKPTTNSGPLQPPVGQISTPTRSTTPVDQANFQQTEELNRTLAGTADVRVEVLERARALANDSQYPPPQVINGISSLIAEALKGK